MAERCIARRPFLRGGSVVGVSTLIAGCAGGDGGDDGGGDGSDGDGGGDGDDGADGGDDGGMDGGDGETTATATEEAQAPFTTEQLREKSKAEAEEKGGEVLLSIYGTPDVKFLRNMIQGVAEEFDAPWIKPGGVSASGNALYSRFTQEHDADRVRPSVTMIRDISNPAKTENPEEIVRTDLEETLAIWGEIEDTMKSDHYLAVFRGGAVDAIMWNTDIAQDHGLDMSGLQNGHGALLEDQFEGFDVVQDFTPRERMHVWAMDIGSEANDMSRIEFARALNEQFTWNWTDGHSGASRFVGSGGGLFQPIDTIPSQIGEFQDKGLPVDGAFYSPQPLFSPPSAVSSVPVKAPAPWTGLFFLSGIMEPPLQRKMQEMTQRTPARRDLEYPDMDPRTRRMMDVEFEELPVQYATDAQDISSNIMAEVFGSPEPTAGG